MAQTSKRAVDKPKGGTPKLTPKQQAFVNAYLSNGFNATQAAITAGYSEKTARSMGAENLTKPDIKAVIKKRFEQLTMSADEAMYRLSMQAAGTMEDVLDENENLDLKEARRRGKLHLIKELIVTKFDNGAVQTKVKLYDSQAALVHIIKEQHLRAGEATERGELRLVPPLPEDQLDGIFSDEDPTGD